MIAVVTGDDLIAHLRGMDIPAGGHVAIHSCLHAFGRIAGGTETVYRALRTVLGDQATIMVPTYTLGLGEDTPYEPHATPSQGMGLLAEHIRTLPASKRSLCPMHNHAADGPDADLFSESDFSASLGPGSDFEVMANKDAYLLLLGCPLRNGVTYLHHVEALVGVPYREWLKRPRRIRFEDGREERISCRYYGIRDGREFHYSFGKLEEDLSSRHCMTSAKAPYGRSIFVPLSAVHDSVVRLLHEDPFAFAMDGE